MSTAPVAGTFSSIPPPPPLLVPFFIAVCKFVVLLCFSGDCVIGVATCNTSSDCQNEVNIAFRHNRIRTHPMIVGRITVCLIQRWQQRDGASRGRCDRLPAPNQRHYFVGLSTQISIRSEGVVPPAFRTEKRKCLR